MFNQLFPQRADNTYRGYKLALWLLGFVLLIKAIQNLMALFDGRAIATGPDAIPVDTFPPAAAQTVLALFALLGFTFFLICVVGLVVLLRYRTLAPAMFTLLVVNFLCRRLILHLLPIPRSGAPPGGYVNLGLFVLMLAGLALSLRTRNNLQPQAGAPHLPA